jgi:MFS family permease
MSGFIAVVSWRWIFWLSLIIAGCTWPILLYSPETYAPVILATRARRLRKENNNPNIFAPLELEHRDLKQMVTVVLARPVRMFFTEAIVLCSCLYLSFVYAIFYMYFQAYPTIFNGIYHFNSGEVGLTFLPIGIGALFACAIYLYWDRVLERAKAQDPPAAWSQSEEYRRLPLACIGGPLLMLSCFWLGCMYENTHTVPRDYSVIFNDPGICRRTPGDARAANFLLLMRRSGSCGLTKTVTISWYHTVDA